MNNGVKIYASIEDTKKDWNQNDPAAVDYIENRPFYEVESTIVMVESEPYKEPENHAGVFRSWYDSNINHIIEVGKSYNVTIDGIIYENIVCFAMDDDSYKSPRLGSTLESLQNNDIVEYPFQIYYEDYYDVYIGYFKDNLYHNIKIEEVVPSVKTVETKYLPEHLQFGKKDQLTECIPKTTLSDYTSNNGSYWTTIAMNIKDIKIGKIYNVTFDDILYENLQCFSDYDCAALGSPYNDFAYNGVNEYPFYLYYYGNDTYAEYSIAVKDTDTHTIKVEELATEIIKLDPKYMTDVSWNDLTDRPFGEVPVAYIDCNPETIQSDQNVWESYYTENINGTIEAGKTYNVTIDGVLYENLICIEPSGSDPYLGSSISDLKNETGEYPFGVYWNGYYKLYNGWFTDNKEHHLKVEELVLKTLDEKYLPHVGGVSSWNDLEDRPFGEEISDEEVLCEASLELGNDGQSSNFPQHIPLVLGETYQVIIDGVEYEPTICKEYKSMYATYNALGNVSLHNSSYGEDTGENYLWIDNFAIYVSDRPNETVSVKLLGRGSTIVQLDEKYIPDTIARTAYVDENFALKSDLQNIDLSSLETKEDAQLKYDTITAAKADWNQNDETAIDYIRNRPFYETEAIRTAILPETTIDVEQYGNSVIFTMPVEEGKTYTVTFDGVEYNCVARGYEGYYNYCIMLGNGTLGGDGNPGNNEPFSIDCPVTEDDATASEFWYDLHAEEGSHTVEVCTDVTTIVQIEKKYIAKHLEEIAGKKVKGQEFTIDGEQVVAGEGAEIFNNRKNIATGEYSHAEGQETIASGDASHTEGIYTIASGGESHAEGYSTIASGSCAHAEGDRTTASGENAHAEGYETTATSEQAHAEGENTNAVGTDSHAEGHGNTASGHASHAEGYSTTATGDSAHAEGDNADAKGDSSHAEGSGTNAEGNYSHAEGHHSETFGIGSHAEGYYARAYGDYSHAEGYLTSAKGQNQHVQGKYNIVDNNNTYAHIVGNGTSGAELSNIHTLDWSGNAWFSGDVYVGSTSGKNKDEGSKKLATEEYVNEQIGALSGSNEELVECSAEDIRNLFA